MNEGTRKATQKLDADPNIHISWNFERFRSKDEKEGAKRENEAWELIDEIEAKRQAIKYENSSKFSRFWIDFFKKHFDL